MQPPNTRRELLSVDDYAARTGISPTEIRRQIRAGTLPAETFQRPQGTYYRVIVDTPEDAPSTSQEAPDSRQEPPLATQALVDALADERVERQRLAAENANMRERVGRAEERTIAADRRADAAERDRTALAERLRITEIERDAERRRSWLDKLLGRWPA